MTTLKSIQEMQPIERPDWLFKKWGVKIQCSDSESSYPMKILRDGLQIGKIVRSKGRIIIELPEIGELDLDKGFSGGDALEIWECKEFEGPAADEEAECINARIHYFVGKWAELHGQG